MLAKTQAEVPEVRELRGGLGGRGPTTRAAKAAHPAPGDGRDWARRVKAFALAHEADLVGIAAPAPPRALADWILGQGHAALPHGSPQAGPALMIPAALQAGFGELGKHGSIINRRHGSSLRLASVLTELPLIAGDSDDFGADGFCASCRVCARACPPGAIADDKQLVRGAVKWYVDFDKCSSYFNESYGCGICIAVCPWSRPGIAPRLVRKFNQRRQRSENK